MKTRYHVAEGDADESKSGVMEVLGATSSTWQALLSIYSRQEKLDVFARKRPPS